MFASADPLAFFDFSSPSWMLETRVAGIPQCQPIPEQITPGILFQFYLHPVFDNQDFTWFLRFIPDDS